MVINQRLMKSLVLTLSQKHFNLKSRCTVCRISKNRAMKKISEGDIAELVRASQGQRGGKSAKYTALEAYRESIVELMDLNVQLTLILKWLTQKQGEQLVVNTLRKYIVRNIGRDFYDEYLKRNGWTKARRKPQPGAPPLPPPPANEEPNPFGYNLNIPTKPSTLKRTQR